LPNYFQRFCPVFYFCWGIFYIIRIGNHSGAFDLII
jgi:hypothetical protein